MSLRVKLGGIFLAAVAVRVAFHVATGFTADDAFITFRYAENLAQGYGFVYNVGERVLGTSTPLFTWLLAVLRLARIPQPSAALLVSLICSGLTAVVLYRFATSLRFGSLAWIPVLLYTLWPRSLPAETCGMETALFTLLVIAAFYYRHRGLYYYAIGLATLATLTRPEGALLLVLVFVSSCRQDRRCWKSFLITPALLLIPWLVFAHFYFGSVLPNSVTAKLALYSRFGAGSWWENLVYLLGWHNPVGWAMVPLAIIGGWWLNRKQDFGRLEAAWLVAMIVVYTLSSTRLFFWYVAPLYPVFLLFAAAVLPMLWDHWAAFRDRQRAARWVLAAGLVATSAFGLYRQAAHFRQFQEYADEVLTTAAFYLTRNVNAETETVAAEDIGRIGYHCRARILDRDGLVSPEAVSYNEDGRYLDLILEQNPRWVGIGVGSPISGFLNDPVFLERYRLARMFTGARGGQYSVYRREE